MIPATPQGRRDFIAANTRRQRPPHTPEIELYLADEITPIWKLTEEALEEIAAESPFLAISCGDGVLGCAGRHADGFAARRRFHACTPPERVRDAPAKPFRDVPTRPLPV